MNRNLAIASFLGFTGLILGAFTTHNLKGILGFQEMNSLQQAIDYQLYHTVVLLFINTYSRYSKLYKNTLSYLFLTGILFFSGSIYAIYLFEVSASSIWFVTPIGGTLLIFGWFLMMLSFFIDRKGNHK